MREVVVVSAARTPFGRFGGALKIFSAIDLGTIAVRSVIDRIKIEPGSIDQIFIGSAASTDSVMARQIQFRAGLPGDIPSLTLDRACCSSVTCVGLGFKDILTGEAGTVVAGGVESMSNTPLLLPDARWGRAVGDRTIVDPLVIRNPILKTPLAVTTGEKALEFGVGRSEQDQWALESHQKYFAAFESGKFADEIIPVEAPAKKGQDAVLQIDESPRADTTLEKLGQLSTVYGSPTVTAGNAPGLNDGSSAVVLMSSEKQKETGLEALGTIVSYAQVSGDPDSSVYMPAYSIKKALQKATLKLSDLRRIEINEAFAAMPLVSTKVLSDGDSGLLERLRSITNVNGGAVAVGHPTGASGTRLIMTLIYELRRIGGGLGVAAICGGYGQSDAVVVKVA